jgi:hypothetical protein
VGLVRPVAVDAQEGPLRPVPVTGALAVDAPFPICISGTVALPAQFIGLFEGDEFAISQVKFVAILEVVAVQAPTLPMLENDLLVFLEVPFLGVVFGSALIVALTAGPGFGIHLGWRDEDLIGPGFGVEPLGEIYLEDLRVLGGSMRYGAPAPVLVSVHTHLVDQQRDSDEDEYREKNL